MFLDEQFVFLCFFINILCVYVFLNEQIMNNLCFYLTNDGFVCVLSIFVILVIFLICVFASPTCDYVVFLILSRRYL